MALNQIIDLSTNAALNTDVGGININEGMFPDGVNNAMRYGFKILADNVTRHVTKAAGTYTAAKTDHNQFWRFTGAGTLNLTAAATLTDGWALWVRANGGAVTIDPNGAELIDGAATVVIPDGMTALIFCTGTAFFTWGFPSSLVLNSGTATFPATAAGLNLYYETDSGIASIGPMAGGTTSLAFGVANAGVYGVGMTLLPAGLQVPALGATTPGTGAFTTLTASSVAKPSANDGAALGVSGTAWSDAFFASGAVLNFNSGDVTLTHSANAFSFAGASSGWYFSEFVAPVSNDACALGASGDGWSDLFLASAAVINFAASDFTMTHFSGGIEISGIIRQGASNAPGSGNNTPGCAFNAGTVYGSSSGSVGGAFNRTGDGNIVSLSSAGVSQGVISIAGATTTYGAFFGSHWSQLANGSKPSILRGTICETIDQMCEWPGEGPEERLPCFKISDTPGSRSVYGVFAWWEIWDGVDKKGKPTKAPTNDAFIGSLGAYVIRIAKGVTVLRGDYIESDGKGCGRVQADDILRASTVAKVTSTTIVETYPDGSYLVPCTLHCG